MIRGRADDRAASSPTPSARRRREPVDTSFCDCAVHELLPLQPSSPTCLRSVPTRQCWIARDSLKQGGPGSGRKLLVGARLALIGWGAFAASAARWRQIPRSQGLRRLRPSATRSERLPRPTRPAPPHWSQAAAASRSQLPPPRGRRDRHASRGRGGRAGATTHARTSLTVSAAVVATAWGAGVRTAPLIPI